MIRLLTRLLGPQHPLLERFDRSPLESVDTLQHFVRTRAAYVAQTALYGYLKTRMGTQFRALFEDTVFSRSIRISASKVFVSCLSDLTVFAVANVVRDGRLEAPAAAALAEHIYRTGVRQGLADIAPDERPDDPEPVFVQRISLTDWMKMAEGRQAFAKSERDLIRFAPVVDEYKQLDGEIVTNSLRFRWTDIRSQFRNRINATAVARDWVSRHNN